MNSPRLARIIIYLSAAIAFAALHAQIGMEWIMATLDALISFRAGYAGGRRVLFPVIANLISQLVPLGNRPIFAVLEAIAIFLLLLAFRELLFDLFPNRERSHSFDLYALVLLIPLLFNYLVLDRHYYPYDAPAMALFVGGVVLIIREKWLLFFVLLAFAGINRETSLVLVLALILLKFGRIVWFKLGALAVTSAAILLAARLIVQAVVPAGGTPPFEYHLPENLLYVARIIHFDPLVLSRFLVFGGLWILILFYWKQQPGMLRRLYLVAIPFLFLPIGGMIGEVRAYSEMVPIIAAGAVVPFAAPMPKIDPATQASFFRRNWAWIAAGVIALGVLFLAVHSLALDRRNLISNYSFERNTDGWTTSAPKILQRSGANAWHGGYSGHIVTTGVQGISIKDIAVQPGARYRLTAWVKVAKGAARVQLSAKDGPQLGEDRVYATNQWTQLTVTTKIPEGIDRVQLSVDDYHQVSDFFVDLVELKRAN